MPLLLPLSLYPAFGRRYFKMGLFAFMVPAGLAKRTGSKHTFCRKPKRKIQQNLADVEIVSFREKGGRKGKPPFSPSSSGHSPPPFHLGTSNKHPDRPTQKGGWGKTPLAAATPREESWRVYQIIVAKLAAAASEGGLDLYHDKAVASF